MKRVSLLTLLFLCAMCTSAFAQYNSGAGTSAPTTETVDEVYVDKRTKKKASRRVTRKVRKDTYGNAAGSHHDLATDGAFKGQTVAVIQLYTMENFDFSKPKAALAEKGFSVYRWHGHVPSPEKLREALEKSCQLWLISGHQRKLTDAHVKVIKEFFDSGKGVYIWGDNDPYFADANFLANGLIGASMSGNLPGYKVVHLQEKKGKKGVLPNHLLTTGIEHLFEGITIATISKTKGLKTLVRGSAGNLVTAFYEEGGKRLILDGGFTRLYHQWDTAGTGRYVKNAAAWLVNVERFGAKVLPQPKKK